VLFVGEREPAERRTQVHADIGAGTVWAIARILERHASRCDRELREAVGPVRAFGAQKVARFEIVDLGCDPRTVPGRIEARDRRDRAPFREHAVPERRRADPQRRHDADPGNRDAMFAALQAGCSAALRSARSLKRASVLRAIPSMK
jgi:hypothetical protein